MVNSISIVIPAFNERWRIAPALVEIADFIKRYPGVVSEVVVVDDGSTDRTMERVMMYKTRMPLTVKQHTVNKGKWGAIRTGIESALGSHILILDADGSASVRELERLGIDYIKNHVLQNEIALFGSRFLRESTVDGKGAFRRVVSVGYKAYVHTMFKWATGKKSPDDMQCPFKLFPKKCLRGKLTASQWVGDMELAALLNCPILDVPIQFIHRGGSSLRRGTVWNMFVTTYKMAVSIRKRLRNIDSGT